MANISLLAEALAKHHIELPCSAKQKQSNGFSRWGKNNRYWAKEVGEGDGYIFGDFVSAFSSYVLPGNRSPNKKEWKKIEKARKTFQKEQEIAHRDVAKKAYELWNTIPPATSNHPYLMKKKIDVNHNSSAKINNGQLVIPLTDTFGRLFSLQFIDADGNKRFSPGGKIKGCFYSTGNLAAAETIYLCEGYATGMSLNNVLNTTHTLPIAVVVCFNAGNLKPVAIELRKKYQDIPIVICADNDLGNDLDNAGNTGLQKAYEAAMAVYNAKVIYPQFVDKYGRDIKQSVDFNDACCAVGVEIIKNSIAAAMSKGEEVVKIKKSQLVQKADSNSNPAIKKKQERSHNYE